MSSFDPYANIDSVLDGIEKDFSLTHSTLDRTEKRTSTGLLSLDLVLGGGIIPGGWYTLFGHEQTCKSTLASTILANSLNSTVPIVQIWDYEGSVSSDYVENIMKSCGIHGKVEDLFGVKDLDGKWVVKPRARYYAESILEKFFDNMAKLQRVLPDKVKIGGQWFLIYDETKENLKHLSGKYDAGYHKSAGKLKVPAEDNGDMQALLIVDSYPSMMPARQDVDELGGAFAVAARAFSEQLKRVKGRMRNKRMTVVGINQLRDKPGVTFGCLRGNVTIPFVDGSSHTMQEIVENKIQGEIWSYNEVTGKIEPKRIIGWHYNGEVSDPYDWIQIKSRVPEAKNNFACVTVTFDHKILTDTGWKKAKDIRVGDKVVTKYNSCPKEAIPFLAGVLCGDSSLMWDARSINTAIAIANSEQPEYHAWKLEKLSQFMDFKPTYTVSTCCKKGKMDIDVSIPYYFLTKLHRKIKPRDPTKLAKHLTLLSLAIMFMDDGHRRPGYTGSICFKRFGGNIPKMRKIQGIFSSLGYDTYLRGNNSYVSFDAYNFDKFTKDIARYVHPSMQYKLPQKHCGKFRDFDFLSGKHRVKREYVEVTSIIQGATGCIRKSLGKYDITVEDNHNYIAGNRKNGIIVSNSPQYEPAGTALKMFSDVRLQLTSRSIPHGKGQLEEEDSVTTSGAKDIYRYIHVRAVKNKLSAPYLETWLRLWVTDGTDARGFDPVWDCWQYGLTTGQLKGSRNNIKLHLVDKSTGEERIAKKGIKWTDFKTLILGDKAQVAAIFKSVGLKPVWLRKFFKAQLEEGLGTTLYFNHKIASGKVKGSESGESDSYDSDSSEPQIHEV